MGWTYRPAVMPALTLMTALLVIILGVIAVTIVTAFVTLVAWMTVQDLNAGQVRREARRAATSLPVR